MRGFRIPSWWHLTLLKGVLPRRATGNTDQLSLRMVSELKVMGLLTHCHVCAVHQAPDLPLDMRGGAEAGLAWKLSHRPGTWGSHCVTHHIVPKGELGSKHLASLTTKSLLFSLFSCHYRGPQYKQGQRPLSSISVHSQSVDIDVLPSEKLPFNGSPYNSTFSLSTRQSLNILVFHNQAQI